MAVSYAPGSPSSARPLTSPAVTCRGVTFPSEGTYCVGDLRIGGLLPKPLPAVVVCNGLRGTKEWFVPEIASAFSELGFASLAFDYRGFGSSGGLDGNIDPIEQVKDIRSALSCLETISEIDSSRLFLFGTGSGGSHALTVTAFDRRVKAVAVQLAIGNFARAWPEVIHGLQSAFGEDRATRVATGESRRIAIGELLPSKESQMVFETASRELGIRAPTASLESIEKLFEYVPEREVHRIAPRGLIVFAALQDTVVPIGEARSIFEGAKQPKALKEIDTTHYGMFEETHRKMIVQDAVRWFDNFARPALSVSPEMAGPNSPRQDDESSH